MSVGETFIHRFGPDGTTTEAKTLFGGCTTVPVDDTYQTVNAKGEPFQMAMTPALHCLSTADAFDVRQRKIYPQLDGKDCNMCDCRRHYDVTAKGVTIFEARENTGACVRPWQRCFPDIFPWEITIDYLGEDNPGPEQYTLKKACSPTCFCIKRPVVELEDMYGTQLGSIHSPCVLWPKGMVYSINDENGEQLLSADSGEGLQCAFCCPMAFGPCNAGHLFLKDDFGNEVGSMHKNIRGWMRSLCCYCCIPDLRRFKAGYYEVDVSKVPCARTRALLLSLAIFTDFRYWAGTDEEHEAWF